MILLDHVAFVTGAGRNLGRAIALRLAREGAGVGLFGPQTSELACVAAEIESMGRKAVTAAGDVSREDDVAAAVEELSRKLGGINILVNNAGVIGPTAPVAGTPIDEWRRTIDVNLTGAFICTRAIAPEMMARRCGRIINISSIAGKIAYPLRSPYAASKWGLIGLTMTLAAELGPHNIQVNAICPGPIEGPRMDAVIKQRSEELGQPEAEIRREYEQSTALGRMVRPDDVASMVTYLASPAGDNITGQAISVCAGYGL